jgi:hypothetical protein
MTSAIGTVSNTSGYSPSTTGTGSAPAIAAASVGEVQTAVALSANAGVIATLGNFGLAVQTYNAAGLLNTIAQAGNAPSEPMPVPATGTDTQTLTQQTQDQNVVGTLPSDAATSGIYNSSGSLQPLSSDSSANWASILKSDPSFASSVIGMSIAQGIIGSISMLA